MTDRDQSKEEARTFEQITRACPHSLDKHLDELLPDWCECSHARLDTWPRGRCWCCLGKVA